MTYKSMPKIIERKIGPTCYDCERTKCICIDARTCPDFRPKDDRTFTWTAPTGKEYSYEWGFGRVTNTTKDDLYNLTIDAMMTKKEKENMTATYFDKLVDSYIKTSGISSFDYTSYANLRKRFEIKDVIFNPPATIVFWVDGTKTVVKAQGSDNFNPEAGLALCFMKRALGNKGNYNNTLKKYAGQYQFVKEVAETEFSSMNELAAFMENARNRTWKIYYEMYDENGEFIAGGKHYREYSRKCDATRIANKTYGHIPGAKIIITQDVHIK